MINTGLCILGSSLFAYLVTKEDMIGRKFVYRFVVITMYIGAGLIPYYITMKAYHLKDTYFLYIIPGIINAFYVILIKTFIEQIPPSLEESAEMDGAGFLRTYASIIMPLSKPIIATVAVYAAVGAWNSWQDNYLLVQNPKLQTVQLILYNCINDEKRGNHGSRHSDHVGGKSADGHDSGGGTAGYAGLSFSAEVFCKGSYVGGC